MLNINGIGKQLCKIVSSKYDGKIISVTDNLTTPSTDNSFFRQLKIPLSANFQMVPNDNTERTIIYIIGPSGSGKSYFSKLYLKEFKKKF